MVDLDELGRRAPASRRVPALRRALNLRRRLAGGGFRRRRRGNVADGDGARDVTVDGRRSAADPCARACAGWAPCHERMPAAQVHGSLHVARLVRPADVARAGGLRRAAFRRNMVRRLTPTSFKADCSEQPAERSSSKRRIAAVRAGRTQAWGRIGRDAAGEPSVAARDRAGAVGRSASGAPGRVGPSGTAAGVQAPVRAGAAGWRSDGLRMAGRTASAPSPTPGRSRPTDRFFRTDIAAPGHPTQQEPIPSPHENRIHRRATRRKPQPLSANRCQAYTSLAAAVIMDGLRGPLSGFR